MEINWTELLLTIQTWRAHLEAIGITYEVLIVIGTIAVILFLASMREIAVWYFRIGQLHEQMQNMHDQLVYIRKTLEEAKILIQMPEEPNKSAPGKRFNLDH